MIQRQYDSMIDKQLRGRQVRALRDLETKGGLKVSAGTLLTISRKFAGFDLRMDKCEHCGVSVLIRRVSMHDVELVSGVANAARD